MAKLNWMIFCERFVVDSATNNMSLMNVLEEVHANRPTAEQIKEAAGRHIALPMACSLVSHWERSNANVAEPAVRVLLRLFSPGGAKELEALQAVDLGKSARARLFSNLPAIFVGSEGDYVWRMYVEQKKSWKLVGEARYQVSYVDSRADIDGLMKKARKSAAQSAKPREIKATTSFKKPKRAAAGRS